MTTKGLDVPLRARVAAAVGWSGIVGYCRNGFERDSTHHDPCEVSWLGRHHPWEEERPLPSYERDWGVVGPLIQRHGIELRRDGRGGWIARRGLLDAHGPTAVRSVCALLVAAFAHEPMVYTVVCRGVVVASGALSGPHPPEPVHADEHAENGHPPPAGS